jgi:hypothetical protein
MSTIDILIIVGFILYALVSGLRSSKVASENLEEYFLAGRSLPGWKAGLSMAATQFAADTPLLVMGLIATGGIFLIWQLWVYGIAFLLMGFVFSATWRRAGILTDAELTEIRYSRRGALTLRVIKALYYGTVINCVTMSFVLVAAVLAGIDHGITHGLEPPAETRGNAFEGGEAGLPVHWDSALLAFENSEFVAGYFGAEYRRLFTAVKRQELETFRARVPQSEYETYLTIV